MDKQEENPWFGTGLVILLIVCLGLISIPGLVYRSIWFDEVVTLLETSGHAMSPDPEWPRTFVPAVTAKALMKDSTSLTEIIQQLYHSDIHPPLYYLILNSWRRFFGYSIEISRLLSLAFSLGTLALVFITWRRVNVPRPALGIVILGTSSAFVFISHEARSYSLAILLVTSAACFLILSRVYSSQPKRFLGAILFGICASGAILTNYLTISVVVWLCAWYAWSIYKDGEFALGFRSFLPVLMPAAAFLTVTPFLINQYNKRPDQYAGIEPLITQFKQQVFMNFRLVFRDFILPWNHKATEYTVWLILALFIGLSFIRFTGLDWFQKKVFALFGGMVAAASIGLLVLNQLFEKNLYNDRYIIFGLVGLVYLLLMGIDFAISKFRRVTIAILVVLISLQLATINWGQEHSAGFPGSNARSIVQQAVKIVPQASSRAVIVSNGESRAEAAQYIYELEDSTPVVVLYSDTNIGDLAAVSRQYEVLCIIGSRDVSYVTVELEFRELLLDSHPHEVLDLPEMICLQS